VTIYNQCRLADLKRLLGECLGSEITLTEIKEAIEEAFLKHEGNIRTKQLKDNYIMQKLESIVIGKETK
jgi:hypothetical protein